MLRECAAQLEEGEELDRHSNLGDSDTYTPVTEADKISVALRSNPLASGGRRRAAELKIKRALPAGGGQDWAQTWDFFRRLNERCVECSLCRKQLCYHNSTASLREHLRRKHHLGDAEGRPFPDEGSSSSESMGQEPELKKMAVHGSEMAAEKREEAIDNLIAGMVFRDLQPLSLVADEGFRRLLGFLEPSYRLPSGAQLAAHLRHRYTLCKLRLAHQLRSMPWLALSTHSWSTPARRAYLTVWVHFIDGRWKPARCVLSTGPTATGSRELLRSALGDLGVPWQAVSCVVRDGGGAADRLADSCPQLSCAARTLQQCIKQGLRTEAVQDALLRARRLVAHFQQDHRAAAQLDDRLAEGSGPTQLLLDTPCHWDTTFDMCQRLLDTHWAVREVLQQEEEWEAGEPTVPNLSDAQWELLRNMLPILKPLKVALSFLGEQQNASVSSLLPCLHGVLAALGQQAVEAGSPCGTVIARIRSEISQRWRLQRDEDLPDNPAVLASFLDPRFKDLRFLSARTREQVQRRVKELLSAALPEPHSPSTSSEGERASAEPKPSEYDLLFGEDPVDRLPELHQQMESYLAEPLRKRHTDPFQWWRDNAHRFPALAGLARRYLAVPATAIPVGRPFLASSRLPDDTGAALSPDDINRIIFLHQNFDYIESLK
ncbi:E3 SUMO-protein ligase ZBED1 [Hypanus sabinus]|uniref:E3 SUMO-protein ligase ZBED1 n=1 Tax=Hypanus sabinus TaxID=79690 RepID=UPI0028C3DD96|nr:E3 SUMO-protein ligase ZBED1 [Hypanus sabinus]